MSNVGMMYGHGYTGFPKKDASFPKTKNIYHLLSDKEGKNFNF